MWCKNAFVIKNGKSLRSDRLGAERTDRCQLIGSVVHRWQTFGLGVAQLKLKSSDEIQRERQIACAIFVSFLLAAGRYSNPTRASIHLRASMKTLADVALNCEVSD